MSIYITPTIGSIGHYVAKVPFDTIVQQDVLYECQSIRTLQDMAAGDEDPYGTIYQPIGLTQADFDADVLAGVLIVTLSFGDSGWLNIPNNYFTSYPTVDGIEYQSKAIAVNLGSLPTSFDFTNVINDIVAIVQSNVGVVVTPDLLDTSPKVMVTYTTDDLNTAARVANITDNKSYKDKYLELQIAHNDSLLRITSLENYIKANYIP